MFSERFKTIEVSVDELIRKIEDGKNDVCTREELIQYIIDQDIEPCAIDWFLDWSRRRQSQREWAAVEALKEIAAGEIDNMEKVKQFSAAVLDVFGDREVGDDAKKSD